MSVQHIFLILTGHVSELDTLLWSVNENLGYFQFKQMETTKMSLEFQLKGEKDKLVKKDKEMEKLKTERTKWETQVQAVEAELNVIWNCFTF